MKEQNSHHAVVVDCHVNWLQHLKRQKLLLKNFTRSKVFVAPTIDGKLDDRCWQITPKAVDFTDRNTDGEPPKKRCMCPDT